jgi:lipopolysaccharide export system protein LptC
MMTYQRRFKHLTVITILGLGVWMALSFYHPTTFTQAKQQLLPDAFMEDVSALILDVEGNPHLRIVTPKMVHYTDDDVTHLETPTLTLYRKSPQPWRITATYAKAIHGTDQLDFWDNVIIQHTADQHAPTTLIKTPTLTIHPTSHTAETKDSITLIQPSIVVKSQGMYADMDSGDIHLLSDARGEYVPTES